METPFALPFTIVCPTVPKCRRKPLKMAPQVAVVGLRYKE